VSIEIANYPITLAKRVYDKELVNQDKQLLPQSLLGVLKQNKFEDGTGVNA